MSLVRLCKELGIDASRIVFVVHEKAKGSVRVGFRSRGLHSVRFDEEAAQALRDFILQLPSTPTSDAADAGELPGSPPHFYPGKAVGPTDLDEGPGPAVGEQGR